MIKAHFSLKRTHPDDSEFHMRMFYCEMDDDSLYYLIEQPESLTPSHKLMIMTFICFKSCWYMAWSAGCATKAESAAEVSSAASSVRLLLPQPMHKMLEQ